ncbi:MAG: fimbrillin family protein, partial [Alloprevotella sp.]
MKTVKFFLPAVLALSVTACSNEEELAVSDGSVAAQIVAGLGGMQSRAVDNQWNADKIGVTVTDAPNS